MKANELMLGDYVRFKHGIDKVVGISWVPGLGDCAWFAASATLFPESVEDVNPIPITPEILEKNGFRNVSNHTLKGHDTYELSFGEDNDQRITYKLGDYFQYWSYDDRWYKLFETQICHKWCVHQLQHALRLCGIDKEIVI